MYTWGLLHMDEQKFDDQLEPIYNSSVPIQEVTWKNFLGAMMIETGGVRESGRSVLVAWHDVGYDEILKLVLSFHEF